MKTYILFFMALALSLNVASSQTRAEKKALKKQEQEESYNITKQLIESGKYEFEATWATPLSGDISRLNLVGGNNVFIGNRVNLIGNSNFVRVNNKDANIFLPYFGRAFRVTNNRGGSGLEFEGTLEKYNVKYNDAKHKIEIKFTTKNTKDQLRFHIEITSKGGAVINVNSNNRQSIRYEGDIKPLKEKSKS